MLDIGVGQLLQGTQPIRNNMGFLTMASQQAPQVNPCSIIYWVQV